MKLRRNFFRNFFILISLVFFRKKVKTNTTLLEYEERTCDNVSKTVGNFWPYAPKIFDFIKRAKRDKNDDNYSDEDVYSITGYILEINNLFEENIIDKKKTIRNYYAK